MTRLILLMTLVAWAPSSAHGEKLFDRLPFHISFQPGEIPGRTGRVGRPLKPIPTMEYPNERPIWDRHPYPGNVLRITFPF